MLKDVLFELGCEELPSASVYPLAKALADHVIAALDKGRISHGPCHIFATPRRLAFRIENLPDHQPPQKIQKKGPAKSSAFDAEGNPTPALNGFVKSVGISVDELSELETDKGIWMVYEETKPGVSISDFLPEMLKEASAALPVLKPMRWGEGEHIFARPVHWMVLLYGNEILKMSIFGVESGNSSYGHRFHHKDPIIIDSPSSYESQLENAYVYPVFENRRRRILEQVTQLADSLDAEPIIPDALLDEVTSIVEWPKAMLVEFDSGFLKVPQEALIASMQEHQKCFALKNKQGDLLASFITVSNIESKNPAQVIAGNAKVMHARLSDVAFFFDQDRKHPLASHIPATEKLIFQKRLGTMKDKADRIAQLMNYLLPYLDINSETAQRAAQLSKCDLLTGMVGELPELQGLMGYYYALHDGESTVVAEALYEQYLPRFAGDELPKTTMGIALSLTDRMDTLAGIFAIGEKPTGVKDPYKLRRNALAIVRIFIECKLDLKLSDFIHEALKNIPVNAVQATTELKAFILERMQSYYLGQGFSQDLIHAVRAMQDESLSDFNVRIIALRNFVTTPAAISLSSACKRVNNLLQSAASEKEDESVNPSIFLEKAEKDLYQKIQNLEQQLKPWIESKDYAAVLSEVSTLKEPVDIFFDQVMVMVDDSDVRKNRLHLLKKLQTLLQSVADIGLLVIP